MSQATTRTKRREDPAFLERYQAFLRASPQGSVYCEPWWLDAVAPGRWDVLTVEKKGKLQACWPLVFDRLERPRQVTMPPLTQKLGILLPDMSEKKYAEALSEHHRLTEALIEQLPAVRRFSQRFHEHFTNWLPFYWRGFGQMSRYTYLIEPLGDADGRWAAMRTLARQNIRKAEKAGLTVSRDLPPEDFWPLNEQTFTRQGRASPFSRELLRRVDAACVANAERKIFAATDADGRLHAAVYLVIHGDTAYYLLGGSDPELRSSGASYRLFWEAMAYAAERVRRFDFEGSMVQSIEAAFRAMGGRQTPYFAISRDRLGPREYVEAGLRRLRRVLPNGR